MKVVSMGLDRHDLHGSVISFELSFSDLFVLFCFISCVLQISRQLFTCLKTKVRPIGSLYFPDVTLKDNLGNKTKLIIFQSYVGKIKRSDRADFGFHTST